MTVPEPRLSRSTSRMGLLAELVTSQPVTHGLLVAERDVDTEHSCRSPENREADPANAH